MSPFLLRASSGKKTRMRLSYGISRLVLAAIGVRSCAESFGPSGVFSRAGEGGASPPSTSRATAQVLASSSASPHSDRARSPRRRPQQPQQRQQEQEQEQQQQQQQGPKVKMLEHTTDDHYDGVTVDEKGLPESVEEFTSLLEASLDAWRSSGKKGVWLKVPADRTELVPVSLGLGFELHHAEKAYVMLNKWLPPTTNQLPANASHQVGVGALVLNDEGDVLVVREKNGPLRGTGIWKLPTGLIDAGEDLPEGAAREVREETGVETEFDSVLAFRHGHRGLFGKSDLFFVVRMRLKPGADASTLQPQESEIEECQWMTRELFAQQNAKSGTVLLRELDSIMDAHLASEAGGGVGEGDGGGEGRGGEDERERERRRHAAAFTAKMLKSSQKYGGKSMLYHGKL